jgi:glycosyltransferase involved in cell wall biosynthesis
VLARLPIYSEVVYVNDGSADGTLIAMRELQAADPRITIVDLSRNFGKEIALTAGMDYASGNAVVIIDADLQDPPELIPRLFDELRRGFDVVYAQRTRRAGDSVLKRLSAALFYRSINQVGDLSHSSRHWGFSHPRPTSTTCSEAAA